MKRLIELLQGFIQNRIASKFVNIWSNIKVLDWATHNGTAWDVDKTIPAFTPVFSSGTLEKLWGLWFANLLDQDVFVDLHSVQFLSQYVDLACLSY